MYQLYRFKKYTDVRLVFAPEQQAAFYGGDPDNFEYPRFDFDICLFRVYENDKPAVTPNFLQIKFDGPAANQLVFVPGHPGSTARLQTRAQLEFDRDLPLPISLMRASELRGRLIQFGTTNPADERIVQAPLNSLQNTIKVRRKELDALNDDALLNAKSEAEATLRAAWTAQAAGHAACRVESATSRGQTRSLTRPEADLRLARGEVRARRRHRARGLSSCSGVGCWAARSPQTVRSRAPYRAGARLSRGCRCPGPARMPLPRAR